jgi:hypothetical protein
MNSATPSVDRWVSTGQSGNEVRWGPDTIVNDANAEKVSVLICEIEETADTIGRRLYRGV